MKEYYFREVLKDEKGEYKFGPDEDSNAYTYNDDKDVINKLSSKLGGEHIFVESTKVYWQEYNEDVDTLIFTDKKKTSLIGVVTFKLFEDNK